MQEEKTLAFDPTEAPLTSHLEEIRRRILLSAAFFLAVFAVCYWHSDKIVFWVLFPLKQIAPDLKLSALSLTEAFFTTLKVAAYTSIGISLPFFFWQTWAFVEPGLLPRERFWVKLLFFPMVFSFIAGALFCYFLALPLALRFLISTLENQFTPNFSYSSYVDFASIFILSTGIIFEVPIFLAILDNIGILPAERVVQRRKEGIVVAFILGAIFSPPDVLSQFLVSIPLVFLFEFGIWFSFLLRKLKKVVKYNHPPGSIGGRF